MKYHYNLNFNVGQQKMKMTIMHSFKYLVQEIFSTIEQYHCNYDKTPTVRGLAADKNNKLYTETMIFLCIT